MFDIRIKDFVLHIKNKHLLLEKSVILFELYAQKSKKFKYFELFSLL